MMERKSYTVERFRAKFTCQLPKEYIVLLPSRVNRHSLASLSRTVSISVSIIIITFACQWPKLGVTLTYCTVIAHVQYSTWSDPNRKGPLILPNNKSGARVKKEQA